MILIGCSTSWCHSIPTSDSLLICNTFTFTTAIALALEYIHIELTVIKDRIWKINSHLLKGLPLYLVDCHRVGQSQGQLVPFQDKWWIDITWCQLNPRNKNYLFPVFALNNCCFWCRLVTFSPFASMIDFSATSPLNPSSNAF